MDDKKLVYQMHEFAKALGISKSLAYELARTGQIPVIKLGNKRMVVPVAAVEKMLEVK